MNKQLFTTERIGEGDVVSVNFNNAQSTLCTEAVVVHRPCATGDSWIFQDMKNGLMHYVSEGCTVTKKMTPGIPYSKM